MRRWVLIASLFGCLFLQGCSHNFHAPLSDEERFLDQTLLAESKPRTFVAGGLSDLLKESIRARKQKSIQENCGGNKRTEDLCGLDYNPVLCGQDDNDGRFVYKTLYSDDGMALIVMRWDVPSESAWVATYVVRKLKGLWQLDGIACHGLDTFNMEKIGGEGF